MEDISAASIGGARKVYRSRSQAITLGGFALLEAILGADGIASGLSPSMGVRFIGVALVVLAVGVTARAALAALIVTEHGLIVRNPLRRLTIPWADVSGFELGRHKVLGCVCLIRLRSVLGVGAWEFASLRLGIGRAGRFPPETTTVALVVTVSTFVGLALVGLIGVYFKRRRDRADGRLPYGMSVYRRRR